SCAIMVASMKRFFPALLCLLLVVASCTSRPPGNETAIRHAIERYLASRPNLNMSGMDMQVGGIRIRENTADADVTFRSKTDAQASMSMHYTLHRRNGAWEVEPQSGGHGGLPPAGHTGAFGSPSPEMPPGHPPVRPQ